MELIAGAGPAFLASLVEFVEALTIVLVVGVTRGWRASLLGGAAAVVVLCSVVLAFGGAVTRVPERTFQVIVGTLLLLFGLRWTRKAVLRYAGVVALHDEDKVYRDEAEKLRGVARRRGFDWAGATVSFKAVALEGLEVIFIVLALGAGGGNALATACVGAAAALVLVVVAGVLVRHPLSRVPENTLKAVVGCMLVSFGVFWTVEGFGATWPGDAASLPLVIGAVALLMWVLIVPTRETYLRVPTSVEV